MNRTVAYLTSRSLLGPKRTLVLMLLPLALLALCVLARVLAGLDAGLERELEGSLAPDLLAAFGIAILMPLLSLIAGTGAIGPEIDDGSIVYLLAKPLNRYSIVVTKLAVAIGVIIVFGVLPVAVAGVVLTGEVGTVTLAYAVGALVAGTAYAAVFLLLAVTSRNAVVLGLIYALIWESLVGGVVPGA
ncbi:MAG TPA: ABC transporter permease subunit, partial [Propionicimonas sp.]|nr:ABC transporter permease subunit [Propionicimonas sp.]